MTKKEFRKHVRIRLQRITAEQIQRKSEQISNALLQTAWWQEADIVLAFCSMKEEVDTAAILSSAIAQNKIIGLPRIEEHNLIFHHLKSPEAQFIVNEYGIQEPVPSWSVLDLCSFPAHSVVIITPGLAFDRQKNRLGRGKGFYDRFLRQAEVYDSLNITAIGLCFSEQLLDEVPINEYDRSVDAVLTEDEMIV